MCTLAHHVRAHSGKPVHSAHLVHDRAPLCTTRRVVHARGVDRCGRPGVDHIRGR